MLRRKVPRRTSAPGLPNPDNDLPLRYLAYPASGVVQCAEVATVEWFGDWCRSVRPSVLRRKVPRRTSAPGLPNPDNDLPLRYLAYPASGVVQCAEVATVEWFGDWCRSHQTNFRNT